MVGGSKDFLNNILIIIAIGLGGWFYLAWLKALIPVLKKRSLDTIDRAKRCLRRMKKKKKKHLSTGDSHRNASPVHSANINNGTPTIKAGPEQEDAEESFLKLESIISLHVQQDLSGEIPSKKVSINCLGS